MKVIEKIKLVYRALQYKNKYDKGGIAYILASIKKGNTVMDIGAHKAGYLYYFRKKVTESGRVYAFEPQGILFNYLTSIKKQFKWTNVEVEHIALSDSTGKVTLYIPSHSKPTNTSSPGATIFKAAASGEIQSTEEVVTETLDSYCNRKSIHPDLLKIDVEGNELRIFNGGLQILKKYKPKIIVEIEARHVGENQVLETFSFLENLGYTGKFIHGINRIPLKEFSFARYQNRGDMKNYCNNFIFE
jgi:FkbM family methyltransferase